MSKFPIPSSPAKKILDIDKDNGSILIDEGWISIKDLVK